MPAFQYRLILKDGTPADPPQFVTATPTWHEGDTFTSRPGRTFRILSMSGPLPRTRLEALHRSSD